MNEKKHASLGDLPAWSSPSTVREIAEIKDSWGMVPVYATSVNKATIVHDERGLLWIDGTMKPEPRFITGAGMPHDMALIFHYEGGIGIYMPKSAYKNLRVITDKQLESYESKGQPRYLPINHVASIEKIPEGVYADDPTTRRLMAERKPSRVTLEGKEVPGEL